MIGPLLSTVSSGTISQCSLCLMDHVDDKYIGYLSSGLEKFKKVNQIYTTLDALFVETLRRVSPKPEGIYVVNKYKLQVPQLWCFNVLV